MSLGEMPDVYSEEFQPSRRRYFVTVFVVLVIGVAGWLAYATWHKQQQNAMYRQIIQRVSHEEAKDEVFPAVTAKEADMYVNDFKCAQTVLVGAEGFSVNTLEVKPQTKLVFKSATGQSIQVDSSPDGVRPKYFTGGTVSEHSLLQTKVAEPGVYVFQIVDQPLQQLRVIVR